MKKILLNFWPLLIISALWFVFSSPFFLKSLTPFPSSYLVNNFGPWSEYTNFTSVVKNTATPDVISQIFPWKKLVIDIWKSGYVPLWNNYSFSGTPLLANYQSAALSPLNLIYFILPFVTAWSIQILLQPLLAGIFMYFFVRTLKVSKQASLISSIAFMFCGFITTWMVYGTLDYAILFLPLALLSIEKFYETQKWYYSILLTVSIPLSFLSGHFQTSLYFLIFVFAYISFRFITTKNLKFYILNLTSISLGLLISAPQLLPSIEFYLNSVRSELFMKVEVIPWVYLPTFLAPDIFGNPVTRNAWFGHYAEWNAYIGLIPLLFALYGLRKRNSTILFFSCVAIISLFLAFQTPLLDLLISLRVPVLSTSAASRIIVIFSFAASVLAGFGFDNLISDIRNKQFNFIISLISGFLIVFGILWATVLLKLFIPVEQIPVALSNLKLPTLLFAIFFTSILASIFLKYKKKLLILSTILILITAIDLLRFATKWQPFDPASFIYPPVPIQRVIMQAKPYDRGFGSFGQELPLTLRIGGLEGYDPLYIGHYGEFINAAPDGQYHQDERSAVSLSKNGKYTGKILDFLGVKYITHKIADGHAIWAFPFWTYPVGQFKTIYQDDKYQILKNEEAFSRAFLVTNYQVISDNRKILQTIFNKDLDLSKNAVLEQNPQIRVSNGASGSAAIESYQANAIRIRTNSAGSSLLILTDPYYPGWQARVDSSPSSRRGGSPTYIYRADYTFRAVVVPAGSHTVTFTYSPASFKIGLGLGVFGFIGMASEAIYVWKRKSRS